MSDEEYEQRKKTAAPVSRREPEESMGGMYFRLCEQALQQGGLEAAEAVITTAMEDDAIRRIENEDDDVILFSDESWFDVGLCFHIHLLNTHKHSVAINGLPGLADETQSSVTQTSGESAESKK